MDNEQKLDALTGQTVDLSLGGKIYTVRKASLWDIGVLNKFIRQKKQQGDDANLDLDASLFIICELLRERYPEITPEILAKTLPPIEGAREVAEAIKLVGFNLPQ